MLFNLFQDNSRRRSPGGVFIQLIKQCQEVTRDEIKEMFFVEERLKKKAKK